MVLRFVLSFALFLSSLVPFVYASETRIAAVVNHEAITARDLELRVKLAMISSNIPDTKDARNQVVPQILKAMIDETLQRQTAKKYKIQVDPQGVQAALSNIEASAGMKPGQMKPYLQSKGSSVDVLLRQIETNLGWVEFIRENYLESVQITDSEIERVQKKFEESVGKKQSLVAEIVVAADGKSGEAKARQIIGALIGHLQQGAPFSAVAQQFSQSASAGRGGDIGWILQGEIEPELEEALGKIPVGMITPPVKTARGIVVLLKREEKVITEGDIPTSESVQKDLLEQRLSLLAQRSLRELRRKAFIEIR